MLLFLGVAWATAGLYVVHAQVPRNVLELPLERVLGPAIPFFAPEGWAFFTRDPREPRRRRRIARAAQKRNRPNQQQNRRRNENAEGR